MNKDIFFRVYEKEKQTQRERERERERKMKRIKDVKDNLTFEFEWKRWQRRRS